MASPPILELGSWDFVGTTMDSSYHGVTILDSASFNVDDENDGLLSFARKSTFADRRIQNVTLSLPQATGSGSAQQAPAPVAAAERWE